MKIPQEKRPNKSVDLCRECLSYMQNEISLAQYGDMQLVLRMFDKMMRIANKKDAFGESPYGDLAGYSILGIAKDQKDQEKAFTEKAQRATGSNKKV